MSLKALVEDMRYNSTNETLDEIISRYQAHPDADRIYIHTTRGMKDLDGKMIGPKIGKVFTEKPNSSKHNPLGVYVYNIKKLGVFTAYRKYDEFNYIIRSKTKLPTLGDLTDDQITLILATIDPKITRNKINQYIIGVFTDPLSGREHKLNKRQVSKKLYDMVKEASMRDSSMGHAAAMTKLWIKCGFDGLYDPGYGILDSLADPAQGVFFKNSAFTVLELVSPTKKTTNTMNNRDVNVDELRVHDPKWL